MSIVIFEPSNAHDGHYVIINGEFIGMAINLHAYKSPSCADYKKEVDDKIEELLTKTQPQC